MNRLTFLKNSPGCCVENQLLDGKVRITEFSYMAVAVITTRDDNGYQAIMEAVRSGPILDIFQERAYRIC